MAITKLNSLAIPPDTIVESDLSYPLTNFSSTGIDDNATSNAITIDSSENVGIGDDDPVARLQVSASSTANAPTLGSISANAPFYLTNSDHAYGLVIGTDAGDGHTWLQGQRTDGSATAYNITLNEAGGKVGIRTDNPDSELDVRGIILGGASSPSTGQIAFGVQYGGSTNIANTYGTMKSSAATCIGWGVYGSPSVTEGFVSSVDTSLNFRRGALLVDQDELRFLNAAQQTVARDAAVTMTERFKVDANGNVLIGKTSGASSIRTQFVGAGSTSANSVMLLENSALTDLFEVRCDGRIMTGTASASPYYQTVSFGANLWINSSGVLYRTTSSARYKESIQDMTSGLSDVLALRPVTFEQKNENTGRKFGGFIAEEVHDAGLIDFVEYNDDGEPDAIGYGNMVSLLTKAIQEQQAMIETLQAEVTALKEAP